MDIVFDNIINARDLGGLEGAGGKTIIPHRLIRSAHLHDATDSDVSRLLSEYNLCRIFDLEAHIVNYSFYPEVQVMAANMYPSLILSEFSQLQYAAFLRLIIEAPEDGGILWHCAQGKDRTGWGAAYILFALGVEKEAIIADFDNSNTAYKPLVKRLNDDIITRGGGKKEMAVIQAFMGVSTENFISTLDLIDREFGSMHEYLTGPLCLSTEDIHILRHRFLK